MKIVVISDTHGDLSWFESARHIFDNADCVFHLGDVVSDAKKLEEKLPCPVHYVAGNCDIASGADKEILISVGAVKIFATHGNRYRVENDLYALSAQARSVEADICLYGHTHVADVTNFYGVWFVNPGSPSRPRGISKKSLAVIERDRHGNICPYTVDLSALIK